MSEVSRYTAGIPPLHTVKDPDTRRVLEAIVAGWRTRNGDLKPNSDERFITKGELQALVEGVNSGYFAKGGPGYAALQSSAPQTNLDINIERALSDLTRDVFNDPLWTDLGERIRLIDLGLVTEQRARIAAVQKQADDLAAEAEARLGFEDITGSAIGKLEETDDEQALLIVGLTTRTENAESTIIDLQETTATQATTLETLETRVGDSETNITELKTTTETQAQTLTSLSTRVGDSETNISTLQTTTETQANTLTTLTADVASNSAAITNEQTARANADNAITQSITTQFSSVGKSLSALQRADDTLTNSVAAVAESVTTLQASVDDNTIAISTEAEARASADGKINAKYTVKIDANGYVSGYGLMSTANNATPTSSFFVRADKFAIGSPSGPGIEPVAPFIVTTTTDTDGNPPGVYITDAVIANASIGNAKIAEAAIKTANIAEANIDTLRIKGNAVTIPVVVQKLETFVGSGSTVTLLRASITLEYPAVVFASACSYLSYGRGYALAENQLKIKGELVATGGGGEGWTNGTLSGSLACPAGTVAVTYTFYGLDDRVRCNNPCLYVIAAMR